MATEIYSTTTGQNTYAGGTRKLGYEVTLASGTVEFVPKVTRILSVQITQKDTTAVADGVSASWSGTTLTIDSSNGSSAETYMVEVTAY